MVIELGSHKIGRIDYRALRPGDVFVTYEALSTKPTHQLIFRLQQLIGLNVRAREFNRMFHFGVITAISGKSGYFRIAHIDGVKGKLVSETDYLPDHNSGQAFLFFRPNASAESTESAILYQMVKTASKTAQQGNPHRAIRASLFGWESALEISRLARTFVFENCYQPPLDSVLTRLAQVTVDYAEKGVFYDERKRAHIDMTCSEYVSYVASVAKITGLCREILRKPDLSRTQRIVQVAHQLKEQKQSFSKFPFSCTTSSATPAYVVDMCLRSTDFRCVGYIGTIGSPSPALMPRFGRIVPFDVWETLLQERISGLDPSFVKKLLTVLRITFPDGALCEESLSVNFRIKAFLACLKAKKRGSLLEEPPIDEVDGLISRIKAAVEGAMTCSSKSGSSKEQLFAEVLEMPAFFGAGFSLDLTPDDFWMVQALNFEKGLIEKRIDRTEKTYYLSLNAKARERIERSLFQKISYCLFPRSAAKKEEERISRIEAFEKALIEAYYKRIPNTVIRFEEASCDPVDQCLWINYKISPSEPWRLEPCVFLEGGWQYSLQLENTRSLKFQIYRGPKETAGVRILRSAKVWEPITTSSTFLKEQGFRGGATFLLT